MDRIAALVRRWWHCLWRLHRPVDFGGEMQIITCDCGKTFYVGRTAR